MSIEQATFALVAMYPVSMVAVRLCRYMFL